MSTDPSDDEPATAKYASTGIVFRAAREVTDGLELDANDWFLEPEPDVNALTAEQTLGIALLRLRLYRGWSQSKLELVSGVDQTVISRLETGQSRGTSTRRLFAILTALRAEEITFGPGPRTVPQSSWEDAMYGDLWERAGRVATARFNRRRSA